MCVLDLPILKKTGAIYSALDAWSAALCLFLRHTHAISAVRCACRGEAHTQGLGDPPDHHLSGGAAQALHGDAGR